MLSSCAALASHHRDVAAGDDASRVYPFVVLLVSPVTPLFWLELERMRVNQRFIGEVRWRSWLGLVSLKSQRPAPNEGPRVP